MFENPLQNLQIKKKKQMQNKNNDSDPKDESHDPSKSLYKESSLMDTEIRKSLQNKDYTISQETKQNYEKEEKDLREFFSELKAPVKEDPTLVRKTLKKFS